MVYYTTAGVELTSSWLSVIIYKTGVLMAQKRREQAAPTHQQNTFTGSQGGTFLEIRMDARGQCALECAHQKETKWEQQWMEPRMQTHSYTLTSIQEAAGNGGKEARVEGRQTRTVTRCWRMEANYIFHNHGKIASRGSAEVMQ